MTCDAPCYTRQRVSFDSNGSAIAGVLYRPIDSTLANPCVVLAHGFSGTMDWIVPEFAAIFASGGIAALIFDYRYLGESQGEPRQLISTPRQCDDLRRAVEYVRSLPDIDRSRIALWGTSLGGHHVLTLAQDDPAIAAVIANVPAVDLFRGIRGRFVPPRMRMPMRRIVGAAMRLLGAAILDQLRGVLGLAPFYVEVYGRLGHAVFSNPDLADLFGALEQSAPSWRNRVTPRFFFTAPRYRDGSFARIAAPLMVTVARDDEVTSTRFVKAKVAQARNHEVREYPVRHFDMYHGAVRDRAGADHLAFLQHHLTDRCRRGGDREANALRAMTFGSDTPDTPRRRNKT